VLISYQVQYLLFMNLVPKTHPVLRQQALAVNPFAPDVRAAIRGMAALLKKTRGVGLAAPQVGLPWAIFLTDVPNNAGGPSCLRINGKSVALSSCRPLAFLNPKVEAFGAISQGQEGCLSLPDVRFISVPRYECVKVEFTALDGRAMLLEASGFFARVVQHEFDHLRGTLITDYPQVESMATSISCEMSRVS